MKYSSFILPPFVFLIFLFALAQSRNIITETDAWLSISSYLIEVNIEDEEATFIYSASSDEMQLEHHDNVISICSREEFIEELLSDLYTAPKNKNDILVFIHGMWGSRIGTLERSMNHLKSAYIEPEDSPIALIVPVKWPGNDMHYSDNKTSADRVSTDFSAELISLIRTIQVINHINSRSGCQIHLLCHSLGNYLIARTVEKIGEEELMHPLFEEAILIAPDLDLNVMEPGQPFSKIEHVANRIHLYFNRRDLTLKYSKDINNEQRLGLIGLPDTVQIPENLYQVDVTAVNDDTALPARISRHHYYKLSPIVTNDILEVLKGVAAEKIDHRLKGDGVREFLLKDDTQLE